MGRVETCGERMMKRSKNYCHNLRREIEKLRRKIEHVSLHVGEENINYLTAL